MDKMRRMSQECSYNKLPHGLCEHSPPGLGGPDAGDDVGGDGGGQDPELDFRQGERGLADAQRNVAAGHQAHPAAVGSALSLGPHQKMGTRECGDDQESTAIATGCDWLAIGCDWLRLFTDICDWLRLVATNNQHETGFSGRNATGKCVTC